MKTKRFRIILLLVCQVFAVACSGPPGKSATSANAKHPLRKVEPADYTHSAMLMGTITGKKKLTQPLLVIAYPQHSIGEKRTGRFDHVMLYQWGDYMLYLPPGTYTIHTVVDFNGDNHFQPTEGSGIFNAGKTVTLQAGDLLTGINIESAPQAAENARFPEPTSIDFDYNSIEYRGKNGQVVKLYDAMFSANNAEAGLWSPNDFLSAFGANIYLMTAYDPAKIPILFVHGSKGSPQDWLPFYIRLDKSRFQPWFFYYPSGMRLTLASAILYEQLSELHRHFGFSSMCLVAHSVGGFVTQSMLTNPDFEAVHRIIASYVTFATPWSGFESADMAVATSSVAAPSWADIASRSVFIKKLLDKPLPATIPHYLFYGKSDSVSEGRALDQRIFERAAGRYGFDVDHNAILTNKSVFQTFAEILNARFPEHKITQTPSPDRDLLP